MFDITELNKPFQLLVHYATGLPLNRILPANQGETSPRDLFCTYNVQPSGTQGAPRREQFFVPAQDCDIPNWEDSEETTIQRVKVRVSLQFFRDGARDAAWKMLKCNYRNSVSEHLLRNEMQWSGTTMPNNLTDLEQVEYRQRYQMDVNLIVEGKIKDLVLMAHSIGWKIDDEEGNELASGDTTDPIVV